MNETPVPEVIPLTFFMVGLHDHHHDRPLDGARAVDDLHSPLMKWGASNDASNGPRVAGGRARAAAQCFPQCMMSHVGKGLVKGL